MQLPGLKRMTFSRLFGIIIMALFLVSCGGGKGDQVKNEGDVSIDQLLGIESEEQKKEEAEKSPDEDEVLRLLGITPEEGKKEGTAPETQETPNLEQLRAEVERLEKELSEKEKLIQDLRRDLEEKDRRLQELQSQALAAQPTVQPASRPSPTSGSFKARYQEALALYNARKYRQAIDAFSALLAEDPNNSLSDNCQYWIGEAYYGLGNYQQAIAEFEKVFAYPNSNKADAALLKLGITYLKLGDRESARAQFEQLIASYPKSEYVEKARRYLNRLQ